VEAVQTGNLVFLTGMLSTEGCGAKFIGASNPLPDGANAEQARAEF
jgi:hypothetical protein